MTVVEHLATVVAELMRADPRRVLLGEDVAAGGMLGLSRVVLDDETLASRVLSTPLVPTILAAHAGGIAAGGRRPIVALPAVGSLLEALAGLREIAALSGRSAAQRSAPVLFIAPFGPGFGLGADAGEGPEATLARISGLRVLCVGQANDAGAMLRAAADFWLGDEPTVLLIPRALLLQELDDETPPAFTLERPLGAVHEVRKGTAATVFAWGEAVDLALDAAASCGQDVAVIDVVSLSPLDRAGLVAAAQRTGKIVIAHAGPRAGGIGAELAALFADEAILHLDAPIVRVTGDDGPLGPLDEARALPLVDHLSAAITQVATY
jgi:pyruvate/2-oxoglutarate/acetoin dehydrogenase E1 component